MAKKILIVDDSAFMRMALRDILTTNGYEVVGEADSCEQAIVKFQELRPDLITLDVVMPGKSGLEILQEIMKMDSQVNALMVTAVGKQSMVIDALSTGAKGFLIKPFDPTGVIMEVKRILGS